MDAHWGSDTHKTPRRGTHTTKTKRTKDSLGLLLAVKPSRPLKISSSRPEIGFKSLHRDSHVSHKLLKRIQSTFNFDGWGSAAGVIACFRRCGCDSGGR